MSTQEQSMHNEKSSRDVEERAPSPQKAESGGDESPHDEATGTPAPPVESLLGLRDFLAVAPRHQSEAVTKAAYAALERWMRHEGRDVNGFCSMDEWQDYYTEAMKYTG